MFVQRDQDKLSPRFGKVKGTYNLPQPGYAEEELADGDPAIAEFNSYLAMLMTAVSPIVALIDKLVQKGTLTAQEAAALK